MRHDLADITILLDRSGSMSVVRQPTIDSFNEFVKTQRQGAGEAQLSLVQFDDGQGGIPNEPAYWEVYTSKPLKEVQNLVTDGYTPRGNTPLNDAIGRAITNTGARLSGIAEPQRPGTVIFVIQTDGLENASREFTVDRVMAMIKEQRDVYKWQFIFLGAGIDAIAAAGQYGINAGKAISYGRSAQGTSNVFRAASYNVNKLREEKTSGNLNAEVSDWSDTQREQSKH